MLSARQTRYEVWHRKHRKTYSGNKKLTAIGVFARVLVKCESAVSSRGNLHEWSTNSHA